MARPLRMRSWKERVERLEDIITKAGFDQICDADSDDNLRNVLEYLDSALMHCSSKENIPHSVFASAVDVMFLHLSPAELFEALAVWTEKEARDWGEDADSESPSYAKRDFFRAKVFSDAAKRLRDEPKTKE